MDTFIAPGRRETDGFVLRSYLPGDGRALAGALNASYDHLRTFLAWAQPETTERGAEKRVLYFRSKWLAATDFVVAVEAVDGETILGGSGFHLREGTLPPGTAEIGMWIRGDAAGCGLGTRVLVEMLRWGFDAWPWERLIWRCNPANEASVRVAQNAGLTHDAALSAQRDRASVDTAGTGGDLLCFVALRSTWTGPIDER